MKKYIMMITILFIYCYFFHEKMKRWISRLTDDSHIDKNKNT